MIVHVYRVIMAVRKVESGEHQAGMLRSAPLQSYKTRVLDTATDKYRNIALYVNLLTIKENIFAIHENLYQNAE